MREAGAPPGRVLGEAWRRRSCGVGVGHRREHALSDAGSAARTTSAATWVPERRGPRRPTRCRARLTSAASATASRWCTADRGVASCTA